MTASTQILNGAKPLHRFKSAWTITAATLAGVAVLDWPAFGPVVTTAVSSLLGTLPFIVFAVALVAGLRAAGAERMIALAFQGREIRTIIMAALFGGLAPFCSCEVIPFVAALLALGAPISAVMAFWLSSPLIDPPTLIITATELGWSFAMAKAITAISLGMFGGLALWAVVRVFQWNDVLKPQLSSGCGCGPAIPKGAPVWTFWTQPDRRQVFWAEAQSNFLFLLKWLALAYLLEGLMVQYVPSSLIVSLVGGDGIGAIFVGALIGMPAYLNSYVAAPLLAGLIEQGMQPGAALAFMTAGAVSCIPAMAAVFSLVKARIFAAYVILGLTGAILAGAVFQALQ